MLWTILLHGSAAWDGLETNRTFSVVPSAPNRMREANPLLRPFAGRPTMYLAIQVDAAAATGLLLFARHRGPKTKWLARAFAGLVMGGHLRGARSQRIGRHRLQDWMVRGGRPSSKAFEPAPFFVETPAHLRADSEP